MRIHKRHLTFWACCAFALTVAVAAEARAWDPFRSESRDVRRGNEHLQKGQHTEAIEAYETAARKLPKDAGVQLNRGLALMASDKLDAAREAFKLATQGSAPKEVRAQSYYDLGLAFMKQAEAAAKADTLDEAQGFLRESVDAFKSSLRNGPKNRDAAWNLELSKRRLVDVEKKQEEKKQEEKKQEEKKQEGDKQQQDEGQKQDGDGDKQDGEQPQKPEDSQKQDEGKPDAQEPSKPDQGKPPPKPEAPKEQPGESGDDEREPQPSQQALPKPMQQALDALSNGEENLEKVRARMRAARQPQRVQKDW